MRIRMLQLAAGPAGVRLTGSTYEVEAAEGAALIAVGAAVDCTPPVAALEDARQPVGGQLEHAVQQPTRATKKKGRE